MAPAATVVFQDVGQHDGSLDGLSVGQTDLHQQAHDSGAQIHNNSYGIPAPVAVDGGGDPTTYDLDSQDVDEAMWRLRYYTIFYAAGNDGASPFGLGAMGSTAKNAVSVGATVHGSGGAEDLANFSSHGPTSDGRIKPDLVAPGQDIVSATEPSPDGGASQTDPPNNNCATSAADGTSFASPTMAGAGLLARQYFFDGFYPSGAKTPADAFDPSNALVKAALINSARDLTGWFTASDGTGGMSAHRPNFGQGWGRVTLDDALFFPGDMRELTLLNDVLNGATTIVAPATTAAIQTGVTHTFMLPGVSHIEDLRVTLNWSDPPGPTGGGVTLVNNLDLELEDPDGVLYRGNVNFVDGFSTPADGSPADALNTVENVFVKDPTPGTWTARVIGTSVPGNGVVAPFASNRQGYALIATGNFSYGSAPLVRFDAHAVSGGRDGDAFLDRAETVDVDVTVRNDGDTFANDTMVSLSVDPAGDIPASAIVIAPPSIAYGTIAPDGDATQTFSVTLLDDGGAYSNKHLRLKVDASADGATPTSDAFEIETMANTATNSLFSGFESGLGGWTLRPIGNAPGLVTCETSPGVPDPRPTPLTELKLGAQDCASSYTNNLNHRAFSTTFFVPLSNNNRLVSINFWHRLGTEPFFDFAQLFMDHNNDGTFHLLTDFNGPDMGEMHFFQAQVPDFFNTGRTSNLQLGFRLLTDPIVTAFPGWFVDDVSVTTKSADPITDTTPRLISADPSSGAQGTPSLDVEITGLNTDFVNGVSMASFSSSGITVNSTTVTDSTHATANLTIDAGATLGAHSITVTTDAEVASNANLFHVTGLPLSVQVTPSSWEIGTIPAATSATTWEDDTPAGMGFFSALNNGEITEDLTIKVSPSASWLPGAAPAPDMFALGWGQTAVMGVEPVFANVSVAGVPLADDLPVGDFFHFDLKLDAPTSTSDFTEQEIIATVEAHFP